MTRVRIALLIVVGLHLLGPVTARGWESSAKWGGHVVGYKVNPSNQDVSDAKALAAIRTSADGWTEQTKAAFRFRYDGVGTATTQSLNGTNLVLFRNAQGSSPTVRASTYTWKLLGAIIETDIVFWDKSMSFVTASMPCSNDIVIENTAIHEFGHALGLDHTDVTTATMWGKSSVCSTSRLVLDPDDIAGIESLYPCTASSQCNDGKMCTEDTCNSNNKCSRAPIPGCCTKDSHCDDGKVCTEDTCSSNVCDNVPISGCCTKNSQCNDGDPCTEDTCNNNVCDNVPAGCDAGAAPVDAETNAADARTDDTQLFSDTRFSSDTRTFTSDLASAQDGGVGSGDGSVLTSSPQDLSGGCQVAPSLSGGAGSGTAVLVLMMLLGWRRRRSLGENQDRLTLPRGCP